MLFYFIVISWTKNEYIFWINNQKIYVTHKNKWVCIKHNGKMNTLNNTKKINVVYVINQAKIRV
jgi:hypothetical protein